MSKKFTIKHYILMSLMYTSLIYPCTTENGILKQCENKCIQFFEPQIKEDNSFLGFMQKYIMETLQDPKIKGALGLAFLGALNYIPTYLDYKIGSRLKNTVSEDELKKKLELSEQSNEVLVNKLISEQNLVLETQKALIYTLQEKNKKLEDAQTALTKKLDNTDQLVKRLESLVPTQNMTSSVLGMLDEHKNK